LTQARLANKPGEGSILRPNRYSPEQGELVEELARAVSDTGERIVANRDREISLLGMARAALLLIEDINWYIS
jgi:hypothetical protein